MSDLDNRMRELQKVYDALDAGNDLPARMFLSIHPDEQSKAAVAKIKAEIGAKHMEEAFDATEVWGVKSEPLFKKRAGKVW